MITEFKPKSYKYNFTVADDCPAFSATIKYDDSSGDVNVTYKTLDYTLFCRVFYKENIGRLNLQGCSILDAQKEFKEIVIKHHTEWKPSKFIHLVLKMNAHAINEGIFQECLKQGETFVDQEKLQLQLIQAGNPLKYIDLISQTISDIKSEGDLNVVRYLFNRGIIQMCRSPLEHEEFLAAPEKLDLQQHNEGKIQLFRDITKKRMQYEDSLKLNMESGSEEVELPDYDPFVYKGKMVTFYDKELPLYASFCRLLVINPYSKIQYPSLDALTDTFFKARKLRLDAMVLLTDYELYLEDELIYRCQKGKTNVYKEDQILELVTVDKNNPLFDKIDENIINKAIEKGYIPEKFRKKLEAFIGFSFNDAILVESKTYGNIKKVREITHEEIEALDPLDKELFRTIKYICEYRSFIVESSKLARDMKELKQYIANYEDEIIKETYTIPDIECNELVENLKRGFYDEHMTEGSYESWNQLQQRYKYLKGDVSASIQKHPTLKALKTVHKYLCNEKPKESLNLCEESLPDLLRFLKMFNIAASLGNNQNFQSKIAFEKGSYDLLEVIFEMMPRVLSDVVFTKTLFPERLKNLAYYTDRKNWVVERQAHQAWIGVNIHLRILAHSLSKSNRMSTKIIKAVRGNSGSGKTSHIGEMRGVLTPDDAKWMLKYEKNVGNRNIHFEGNKMVFAHVSKEIKQSKNLYYTIDRRLIELDDIINDVVIPALWRNCKVSLSDLDVPFLTSVNRMFKRTQTGKDPLQAEDVLKQGFKGIRENRSEIIDFVKKHHGIFEEYKLYYKRKLVAEKVDCQIIVHDQKAYEKITLSDEKLDEKIDEKLSKIINDDYIKKAIKRGDLREDESKNLKVWIGVTVRKALAEHNKS